MITDGIDSSRLLVDSESVVIEKYGTDSDNNNVRIHATMKLFVDQEIVIMVAVIDGTECVMQQGGQLSNIISDDGSTLNYFWSMQGNRLYDAQGQWLCGYFLGTIEQYSNEQDSTPKITM